MLADHERVAVLEERLGLPRGALKQDIAIEALRHGSHLHERRPPGEALRSNERLEFLGDSVLGFAVAARVWNELPDAAEGDLTRLRAAVVKADALAGVARGIGLGELLLLGRGEERSGGREKQNLLADALEAVIAAVYLSCGLERAVATVDRLLAPLFEAIAAGAPWRDYKTELQQLLQSSHRAAPRYQVRDAPGPEHARIFQVEVTFQDVTLGAGSGRTKKDAEQAAARVALEGGLAALEQPAARPPASAAAPASPEPELASELAAAPSGDD